jgi:Tol biopolymer transport system component
MDGALSSELFANAWPGVSGLGPSSVDRKGQTHCDNSSRRTKCNSIGLTRMDLPAGESPTAGLLDARVVAHGKKIVYLQQSGNGNSLWLSDPDGKNPRMLIRSGINMEPSWLPDSKNIVWFVLMPGRPAESSKLYVMDTETLQSRELFTDPEQVKFGNLMPAVSPDGTKVAFVSNRSGQFRIWLSNLDGSRARPISPPAADLDETLQLPIEQKVPSWSPDGQWIAHWEGAEMDHLSRSTGRADPQRDALIEASWNVWIVGRDGKNKHKAGHGDDPIWSPDGFLSRSFPDPAKGGANVMIQTKEGWKELPILPPRTTRYGRFTWKP